MNAGYCGGYEWQFGWEELLWGLRYMGPCVVGTRWYDSMMRVDSEGFVNVDTSTGSGGHAWLLWKIDIENKVAHGLCAWKGFGYNRLGKFKIRFSDLQWLMNKAQGGEGVWAVKRKNPFTGEVEEEEKKMYNKAMTYALHNVKYRTGVQLYSFDSNPIEIKVTLRRNDTGEKVTEAIFALNPYTEQLIRVWEIAPKSDIVNYAMFFSCDSPLYKVTAYQVDPFDRLSEFQVGEVPTSSPNE